MSDYKNIRGKKVKFLTSDLSGEQSEGQIFYSDTNNDFKVVIGSDAWSASGSLITARGRLAGAGTQTAGLAFGGRPPDTGKTEEYNGTSWSEQNDMNTARRSLSGCGIQTAALAIAGGGGDPYPANVEQYDGTSWTEIADLPIQTRTQGTGARGTTTAGLSVSGQQPPGAQVTTTYEWSSTSNTIKVLTD